MKNKEVQPIPVEGFEVLGWSPGQDGEGVPCTQVHLLLTNPSQGFAFVVRLKSRRIADELIAALIENRDFVWPEEAKSDAK